MEGPRDPNRIEPFLARLEAVWKAYPDMRLGQLIVNVHRAPGSVEYPSPGPELFYVEDDELLRRLTVADEAWRKTGQR